MPRGGERLDKLVAINQTPIGRTPRSNPSTYNGALDPIRAFFAELPDNRARGWTLGRFSFNVKGRRCEACEGEGIKRSSMHFLPEVEVSCDVCTCSSTLASATSPSSSRPPRCRMARRSV